MKKLLMLSALGLSLGASTVALAANGTHAVKGGMYIGAGLGIGGMDTPKGHLSVPNVVKQSYTLRNGVAYRVAVGYLFPVTAKLLVGVEGGYTGYPRNKYSQDASFAQYNPQNRLRYTGHTFDVLGVAKYYFGDRCNVFAKAGGAVVYQKTHYNLYNIGGNPSFIKKINKILPEAAVGVGYDITSAIGVNVTYNHVFGTKPSFNVAHVQNIKELEPHLSKVASVNTLLGGVTLKFNV